MAITKAQFIILRKIKTRESDLVLQCISKEHGKISCLARGALKSRKRFGGGILEPTHVLEGIFPKLHQDHRLSTLSEAKLVCDFSGIKKSYEKLQTAFEILAIYNRTLQENDISARELYDLLGNSLRALDGFEPAATESVAGRACELEKFFAHFAVKFLALQGVLEFEDWQKLYLKESILKHGQLSFIDLASGQVEIVRLILGRLGQ